MTVVQNAPPFLTLDGSASGGHPEGVSAPEDEVTASCRRVNRSNPRQMGFLWRAPNRSGVDRRAALTGTGLNTAEKMRQVTPGGVGRPVLLTCQSSSSFVPGDPLPGRQFGQRSSLTLARTQGGGCGGEDR